MNEYILSLSYGKDSMACIHVIRDILKMPLDRIVTADVWFDDETPADLPEVWEFKKQMDVVIKERYGIEVEHICAIRGGVSDNYKRYFYGARNRGKFCRATIGFPMQRKPWCNKLKTEEVHGVESGAVQYLGIAADETKRITRHINKPNIILPLVDAGWDEDMCGLWCKYSGMLSPTYTHSYRDGCWFCHNQGLAQLRYLRANYPDLWAKLLKLDTDSPVTFKADGSTVHDFDKRFQLEDEGLLSENDKIFRWKWLDNPPPRQLDIFGGSEIFQ